MPRECTIATLFLREIGDTVTLVADVDGGHAICTLTNDGIRIRAEHHFEMKSTADLVKELRNEPPDIP